MFPAGNTEGYPFGRYPRQKACNPYQYANNTKNIALLSLSDNATTILLKKMASSQEITISMEIVTAFREYLSHNLIAETISGDPNSIVIFGSHLDSVRSGPGINDDGSGAMATLELARIFHETGLGAKAYHKVRFAWWTAEGTFH